MSGKHRESRRHITSGALWGSAYAVGGALAITAAVTPAAQAGPDWGPIVACESGGNPTASNPSSTASGLYQFLDTSWKAYGGGQYASRAKFATPAQQTEIANRAFAQSGLSPWTASRGCWGGKVSATVSAPRHAAPAAPAIPLPVVAAPRHAAPERVIDPQAADYVVADGDTLGDIAAAAHTPGGWQALAADNTDSIADPNLINVGQHLRLHPVTGPATAVAPASVSIEAPEFGNVLSAAAVAAHPGLVRAQ